MRGSIAFKKFLKDLWAVFSILYIFLLVLVAIFAYQISPDSTSNANQMHLSIHSQSPGFRISMLVLNGNKHTNKKAFFSGEVNNRKEIPIQDFKLKSNGVEIQPYGSPLDHYELIDASKLQSPLTERDFRKQHLEEKFYLLGTDKYGRDLLSRLIVGSRISLSIGFIAVFISLLIGIILGALAGFFGGYIDKGIVWLINVFWSIPTLLMVIAITLALGRGFWQVFIAVGLTMWVEVARLVRGQVLTLKEKTFIKAAQTLGYGKIRIIWHHIIPLLVPPLIVISAANFASAILIESGLSFLGIGAQPPVPSWGGMVKDHFRYLFLGKPYLTLIPGLAIMSLVLAFMTLGNSLRDILDVKH
ncbi:MAG: ABC transporter permease [Flavobacteriaceae bacterium]